MKIFAGSLLMILSLQLISSCSGKGGTKNDMQKGIEISAAADTGYTGIKQYMSNQKLVKEVTFKNGVREGLMKSFYIDGKLRQTFWYENNLRQDSAKWYYPEGQVFRSTPYKNDTIDGTQKQYYRTGKLKAQLIFKKGLRTPYLQEFTQNGELVRGYPDLVISFRDEYMAKGSFRVTLGLSDKSTKVRYYQGDFSKGVFDTANCKKINTIDGIGNLHLKKTGSPKPNSLGVIAEIVTAFGNSYLVYKKIDLPYTDLN